MEYLREDVVEKEDEIETASCKIRTIEVEESSDKTETLTQDVDVSQNIEALPGQERKTSLVYWIKIIGKIQY